jgi:ABC-type multidrug transport system ATPase subunit
MAILGHNGAGKTTLFNILTGQITYDRGGAQLNGLDIVSDIEEVAFLRFLTIRSS